MDMVCLGNICINTLHKRAKDDVDYDNNNNNLATIKIREVYNIEMMKYSRG
jgi:hypothetical protein